MLMTDLGVWGKTTSPYHQGERALHDRYGRHDEQTMIARRIHAPQLDPHQQAFLASLEYIFVGSVDRSGRPWASVLFGDPGFTHSPDASTIDIDAAPLVDDPLRHNMTAGSPMSIVGIDLSTRQRIRSNLTFGSELEPGLRLHVDQAYGNCPKYIQTRTLVGRSNDSPSQPVPAEAFTSFTNDARTIIDAADTLFVASHNNVDDQHDVGGVDINHRGGRPGFARIDGDTLIIPDYIGNFAFNTLGNFLVNPVAGLMFVDFENGDILQLTGRTEILWEDDDEIANIHGAQRGWRFTLDKGLLTRHATTAQWKFGGYSSATLRTGTWTNDSASEPSPHVSPESV